MILSGDALHVLPTLEAGAAQCCFTSPPYYAVRDYKVPPTDWPEVTYSAMIGLPAVTIPAMSCALGHESTVEAYVGHLLLIFREVYRILPKDGAMLLNLGDSYAGKARAASKVNPATRFSSSTIKQGAKLWAVQAAGRPAASEGIPEKNLLGVPWRVAFALQADGWILRQDIIWGKTNPMPESIKDRCTKAHEYIFLFSKSKRYYWDRESIAEAATVGFAGSEFTKGKTLTHQDNKAGKNPRAGEGDNRPQMRRARQLAEEKGLTQAHLDALRAVGLGMSGQAKTSSRQTGTGKNMPEVQRLAAEAEAALGSYAQEFLTSGTRNPRTVWMLSNSGTSEQHFAVMSPQVAERCVLAITPPDGTVLDPFLGAGTTMQAAHKFGRSCIGVELSPAHVAIAEKRVRGTPVGLPLLGQMEASA